ncbi:MAG: sigma-70 family RNA polymerase sigma factor [Acidobacteria bacterium]|nr:sigma-70 family RNA polymerase sigma factor [Acidobacteriota bacterium]
MVLKSFPVPEMVSPLEKHSDAISEAVARVVSRAENARGLSADDLRPRVAASLEKFYAKSGAEPDRQEIREFIDEIRADDLCLIIACERGDDEAWEYLVANFDPSVRSAARKMTSNAEDADDLAGSIWAELHGLRRDAEGRKKTKLAYYSGRGSLAGWLRAVVSQLAVDEFRKQSKLVQIEEDREFENLANEASMSDNGLVAHAANPEEQLTESRTSADVVAALGEAVAALEDEDRLLLKLYYFDDLKLKDIAATFGYHEATASRKLSRIQQDIRKAVEKTLRQRHGWTETEVKRHLAEAAEKTGFSFERVLAGVVVLMAVQEMLR